MRLRSEWLTLFTVTTLAAGALFLHRGASLEPAAAAKRPDVAASGIDFMPVGSTHPLTDARPTADPRPAAKPAKPRAKPVAAHR